MAWELPSLTSPSVLALVLCCAKACHRPQQQRPGYTVFILGLMARSVSIVMFPQRMNQIIPKQACNQPQQQRLGYTIFILGLIARSVSIVLTDGTTISDILQHLTALNLVTLTSLKRSPCFRGGYNAIIVPRGPVTSGHEDYRSGWFEFEYEDIQVPEIKFLTSYPADSPGVFEAATDIPQADVKMYRKFACPDALGDPGNVPFFSVENAPHWITSYGYQLFLESEDSPVVSCNPEDASPRQLKAYRRYMLSDQYVAHPFFSLESTARWINPVAFQVYMDLQYSSEQHRQTASTPSSSRAPLRAVRYPSTIGIASSPLLSPFLDRDLGMNMLCLLSNLLWQMRVLCPQHSLFLESDVFGLANELAPAQTGFFGLGLGFEWPSKPKPGISACKPV
ncbi:hypothetical protein DFH07DRAFT_943934 [Mycena maculata]|uniref:Uncharacterized protein n=1 Tax=Mycena maculata TaxID=230809 RepID=A0AAD7ICW5_9AGAR|nr:hypothetical protein DFH07DRAFT_943934 [Mycena maculata]